MVDELELPQTMGYQLEERGNEVLYVYRNMTGGGKATEYASITVEPGKGFQIVLWEWEDWGEGKDKRRVYYRESLLETAMVVSQFMNYEEITGEGKNQYGQDYYP